METANQHHRFRLIVSSITLAAAFALPILGPSDWVSLVLIGILYAMFAVGLNVVVGWTGLLDLGAAGFVAIGAYTTAILMTEIGWPLIACIPSAFTAGFVIGILLGFPTLRHRLDYFALLTLGFAELVALGIRNWPALTGGSYGYSGIPASSLPLLREPLRVVPPTGFYYLSFCCLALAIMGLSLLRRTRLGQACHVIKHSELLANSCGINVVIVKLIAFGISASLLATGGCFLAAYQRSIVWTEFGVLLSCMLLVCVIVGGIGSPLSCATGGCIVGISIELLRRFLTMVDLPQNTRFLFFAIALLCVIILRPRGLFPDQPQWYRLLSSRKGPTRLLFTDEKKQSNSNHCLARTDPVLTIHSVAKRFGGVHALRNVSVRVNNGEWVALIGRNGSGKTTLFNLISGTLRPDEGQIWICKRLATKLPAFRISRMGLARSFQDIMVIPDVTPEDHIGLTTGVWSHSQMNNAFQQFNLAIQTTQCQTLSYGYSRMLDVVRTFANYGANRLVLLDEPTAGLTQREAADLIEALRGMRERTDAAVVVVSHDFMFLDALVVDRAIVIEQGAVIRDGSYPLIRADEVIQELFGG